MKAYVQTHWRSVLCVVAIGALASGLLVTPWALASPQTADGDEAASEDQTASDRASAAKAGRGENAMQVFYLEVVTKDVDGVCAAYAAAMGVEFGKPDAGLGNARTAPMLGGGLVGVRAPLRETEAPVARPYWLVDDIKGALDAAEKAGGQVAMTPTEIPGHGTFAIYVQGGNDHGLWQR